MSEGYQSFSPGAGDSDSQGKLAALKLPLAGKRVLDLGCNTGWFRTAATGHYVGIDAGPESIRLARARFPEAEFHATGWDEYLSRTNETFDVVLWLSAMHYAADAGETLRRISNVLAPGGVLCLECGVADVFPRSPRWVQLARSGDTVRHPNVPLLAELLKDFAPRLIGRSVMQPGDPVERWVYHCPKRQPVAWLVGGPSMIGKSLSSMRSYSCPVFSLDEHLYCLDKFSNEPWRHERGDLSISYAEIEQSHFSRFAETVVFALPPGDVAIEGYGLRFPNTRSAVESALSKAGYRVWTCERGD
jgi:SAM-dependent methyltransferase